MAKYKGHDRAVFLDGYAQGWADARAGWEDGVDGASVGAARFAALRYTDAPRVGYNPGGKQTGVAVARGVGHPRRA